MDRIQALFDDVSKKGTADDFCLRTTMERLPVPYLGLGVEFEQVNVFNADALTGVASTTAGLFHGSLGTVD
jgi:hypothetical protein